MLLVYTETFPPWILGRSSLFKGAKVPSFSSSRKTDKKDKKDNQKDQRNLVTKARDRKNADLRQKQMNAREKEEKKQALLKARRDAEWGQLRDAEISDVPSNKSTN